MQAARGASLSSSDPEVPATAPALPRRRIALFFVVALVAFLVDQMTKYVAVERLSDRPNVRVVGDLFQLTLARNPGAAFSTGTGFTEVFAVIAIVATAVVIWFGLRARSALWAFGLGMLLAGVMGNLADRIFRAPGLGRGGVVDWIHLAGRGGSMDVADVAIQFGVLGAIIAILVGERVRRTRKAPEAQQAGEGR
jgi:signal peptidase II